MKRYIGIGCQNDSVFRFLANCVENMWNLPEYGVGIGEVLDDIRRADAMFTTEQVNRMTKDVGN